MERRLPMAAERLPFDQGSVAADTIKGNLVS